MITGKSGTEESGSDPRMVCCAIGSVQYEALVDSGATVNTITSLLYDKIKTTSWLAIQNVVLHPLETLKGYGSDKPINVQCSFDAYLKIPRSWQSPLLTKFFVVKGTSLSLLGYQTAIDLKLLRIGNNESNKDDEQVKWIERRVNSITQTFPKVPIDGIKFRVNEDVTPKQIIRYNIPIAFEEDVNKRLHKMEAQGIIERADDDNGKITFVSPLVVVPKGTNDFRIVVDYRQVNKAIIREPYPMPTLDRIWADIPNGKGSMYFSKLDLSDAFFHIELHKDVRHYTTFMTSSGLMRFNRLPFGLSCSPELFQKVMERIMVGCEGTITYLDDILVFGSTIEELEHRTAIVKATLSRNNLTINNKKSQYYQSKIDFVGLTIDGGGILPTESKLNDIMNFERPRNISELRSFLGMMVFISPFIKDFSSRTAPLRKITQGKSVFRWDSELEKGFLDLKSAASKDIVKRGYFSKEDQTILYTDASPWGIGAVLVQIDAKTMIERIIACASKSLTPTECKYPQLHREALAIVWSMEKFAYYLLGRRFTLKSDSEALKFMINRENIKDCGKRIMSRAEGWFLRLELFDFHFEHVRGENNIADSPSRLVKPQEAQDFGSKLEPQELCLVTGSPQNIHEHLLISSK